MPECLTAENLGLFFLWMVTHPSGKKNLLLSELFSSVSLDDLFTNAQAFVAEPSHRVLCTIKTQLHHSGFSSVNTKGTPKRGIKTALVGEMVNGLLPVLVLLLVFEWGFCYLCDCFHGISDGNWIQPHEIFWGRCATGNVIPASNTYKDTHTHKRNVRAHWKKTQQARQYITSCAKLDLWT